MPRLEQKNNGMPGPRKISDWFVFNLFGYKFDLKTLGELVSWVLSLGFDWNYIEVFIPCSKQRFDWFWKWWAMLSIATTYAFLEISWLTHSELIHGITKRVAIMGSTRPSRSHRQCECFFRLKNMQHKWVGCLSKLVGPYGTPDSTNTGYFKFVAWVLGPEFCAEKGGFRWSWHQWHIPSGIFICSYGQASLVYVFKSVTLKRD
jgi:hypothetical protein